MQKLHLVGFTTDHEGLILSARKGARSGSFVVPLDDDLVEAIDDVVRLRDGSSGSTREPIASVARARRRPPPESALTPREIQARLRAGRSVTDVAGEAGVDTEWVERWAAPVIAEQAQLIEQVRGLHYSKPRLGLSSQPLGVAISWNLRDKGVDLPEEDLAQAWSAFQHADGSWAIRLSYSSRHRKQVAEWELDSEGDLLARNRLASELGYVEPGRRRRRKRIAEDAVEDATPKAATRTPAKAAKRTAAKRAPAKRAPAKRAPAKPAKRSTAKRTPAKPAKRAPAKRKAAPARKAASRKVASRKAASRKPATKKPAAAKRPSIAVRRSSASAPVAIRRPRPLRAR